MSDGPVVRVAQGELLGRAAATPSGGQYFSFQGVPYARPPVGSLRFKEALSAESWEGVRDATAEGNICAQVQTFPNTSGFIGGEDCLFINVYTPTLEGEFLPVMVWSHAGTFDQGSGNSDIAGPEYLVEKDVVLVTFNYRVGPLGFLSLDTSDAPGNAGLKDQVLALKWVKENIGSFGGNSGNITVFGEGAGGASSSYLTLSPLSKDLISKAIFQSGTSLNPFALVEDPVSNAKELAKHLGCDSDDIDEIFNYLQAVSVRDIVETCKKLELKFAPVVEKEFPDVEAFITENPLDILASGRGAKIPIVIGRTAEEAAIKLASNFSIDEDLRNFIPKCFDIEKNSEQALELASELKKLYFNDAHIGMDSIQQYLNLLGDKEYAVDIHRYIKVLTHVSNQPIYSYRFSYVGALNLLKKILESFDLKSAGHMDELGYLFGVASLKNSELAPSDVTTRETMVQMWTNFAKTGNPTPEENSNLTVTWLPVTAEHHYFLDIRRQLILGTDLDWERMSLWDGWYNKYYKTWSTHGSPVKVDVEDNRVEESPVNAHFEYEQPELQNDSGITDEATSDSEKLVASEDKNEMNLDISDQATVASPLIEITSPVDSPVNEDLTPDEVMVQDSEPSKELESLVDLTSPEKEVETEVNEPENAALNDEPIANGNNDMVSGTNNELEAVTNGRSHNEEEEVIDKIEKVIIEEEKKIETQKKFEVKVSNGASKDIIRANDPPEDDLPKNIGVNKFVNFFESLGGKKN